MVLLALVQYKPLSYRRFNKTIERSFVFILFALKLLNKKFKLLDNCWFKTNINVGRPVNYSQINSKLRVEWSTTKCTL